MSISSITEILSDINANTAIKYVGFVISDTVFIFENDPESGKEIHKFCIQFTNGLVVKIYDAGQQCCEQRYVSTDDDINSVKNHKLIDIVSKPISESIVENDERQDICFIEIITTGGCITLVNHNNHNGFYSGFDLTIEEAKNL